MFKLKWKFRTEEEDESTDFMKKIDEMILSKDAKDDEDLSQWIEWIDTESKKRGVSFYDQVFDTLQEQELLECDDTNHNRTNEIDNWFKSYFPESFSGFNWRLGKD